MTFEFPFDYEKAFGRNRGLITLEEQVRLRRARVALAGLGAAGSASAEVIARMGVGAFNLADPGQYELADLHQQLGATIDTLGRAKVEVVEEVCKGIHPQVETRLFFEGISPFNIADFLDGVDVVVDGIDLLAIAARRMLHQSCRERRIPVVYAGSFGHGVSLLVFTPEGPSFDELFGLDDRMSRAEQLLAFAAGLRPPESPSDTEEAVTLAGGKAPALSPTIFLGAAATGTEVLRLLARRPWPGAAGQAVHLDLDRGRIASLARSLRQRLLQPQRRLGLQHRVAVRAMHEREQARKSYPGAQALTPDSTLGRLLQAAARAPSNGNLQPWSFLVDPKQSAITVVVKQAGDLSPMNPGQTLSRLACGAAVENLFWAAPALGRSACLTPSESGDSVRVEFAPRSGPLPEMDPLRVIEARVTNRRLYYGRTLHPELAGALAAVVGEQDGARVHFILDRERIGKIAQLVSLADEALFSEPAMRKAFLATIRFDAPHKSSVEYGLPLASLASSLPGRANLRLLKSIPERLMQFVGTIHQLASHTRELIESASGLAVGVVPEATEQADFAAGRMLQRTWLTLAARGFSAQPMMSPIILASALERGTPALVESLGRERLRAMLETLKFFCPEIDSGRPLFILRFGHAPPPTGRAGRLPIASALAEAA